VESDQLAALDAALNAEKRCPFVLDADALTLLAPLSRKLDARDVLTPHVGEFNRLFPGLLDNAPTRIDAALEAAQRASATVLLKGPDTVDCRARWARDRQHGWQRRFWRPPVRAMCWRG